MPRADWVSPGCSNRLEREEKHLNLPKLLSHLFRSQMGLFRLGGQISSQLSQPQKAFLLPSCTYSIFPLLVPSRQEHDIATWRAGRGKPGARYTCVSVSASANRSPVVPYHPISSGCVTVRVTNLHLKMKVLCFFLKK